MKTSVQHKHYKQVSKTSHQLGGNICKNDDMLLSSLIRVPRNQSQEKNPKIQQKNKQQAWVKSLKIRHKNAPYERKDIEPHKSLGKCKWKQWNIFTHQIDKHHVANTQGWQVPRKWHPHILMASAGQPGWSQQHLGDGVSCRGGGSQSQKERT